MDYYVYGLFDNQGVPFYIGKGLGNRFKSHLTKSHNDFVNRKIAKLRSQGIEPYAEKVCVCDSEEEALDYEAYLIQQFGLRKHGGTLCNIREEGLENSQEGIPIWYNGFIFPSMSIAARKTGKSGDQILTALEHGVALPIDSEEFLEASEGDRDQEMITQRYFHYLSEFHPRKQCVWAKGFLFPDIQTASKKLGLSKSEIHRQLRRGSVLYLDDAESVVKSWEDYHAILERIQKIRGKGMPVVHHGVIYRSIPIACEELSLDRDTFTGEIFNKDNKDCGAVIDYSISELSKMQLCGFDKDSKGSTQPFFVNGVFYRSIPEAVKGTGESKRRIISKLKSKEYPKYIFLKELKNV